MKTGMRHIFVSPHIDDAVLSCFPLMHACLEQGMPVELWTIMAGIPSGDLPFSADAQALSIPDPVTYVEKRRTEDREVGEALGATIVHFDFPDAIYRTALQGDRCILPYTGFSTTSTCGICTSQTGSSRQWPLEFSLTTWSWHPRRDVATWIMSSPAWLARCFPHRICSMRNSPTRCSPKQSSPAHPGGVDTTDRALCHADTHAVQREHAKRPDLHPSACLEGESRHPSPYSAQAPPGMDR